METCRIGFFAMRPCCKERYVLRQFSLCFTLSLAETLFLIMGIARVRVIAQLCEFLISQFISDKMAQYTVYHDLNRQFEYFSTFSNKWICIMLMHKIILHVCGPIMHEFLQMYIMRNFWDYVAPTNPDYATETHRR